MRKRRFAVLTAALMSGALFMSACTSESSTTEDPNKTAEPTATSETTEGGTSDGGDQGDPCLHQLDISEPKDGDVVFTAGPGDWSGYNNVTSKTYSTYNSVINAMFQGGFWYYGTDGTWCEDKDYGTVEVTSESPLTIEYTISDDAVWSDGTPVTINDFLLDWATQNPEWLAPGFISEGDDANVVFDHVSTSFPEYVPEGPQGEVNSKKFTVVFPDNYPDWKLVVGGALPAHVAANKSGLNPEELAQAILDRDADTVKKVKDFWNEGWAYNPGQLPPLEEVPSAGPYKLKADGWKEGNSLTLEYNDKYWGTPPATKNIVFRFIDDKAQVQALQNQEVHAISPQATVDTVSQLNGLGDAVTVETVASLTWEHLDYNFRDTSVFADSKGGLKLREAFAYCVPRQTIVDSLIKPIAEDSVLMNAREVFPFQSNYDEVVSAAYDGRYDQVDLDKAKALVEESGVATPVKVRVGYRSGNQRRTETVAAIKASCDQVGFEIEDTNSEDFFTKAMPAGDYEIALYAWAGSGQKTSGQNIYATGKPQNYGEFSNKNVDEAWDKLVASVDEAEQLEQIKVIEKELWDNLFGIPLYAHPGVNAYVSNMENVRPTSTQSGLSWNAFQWQMK